MMQKHAIARAVAGARWNPRDGLIGGDQGLWLDPSDLTTMFQDAAGTTPVTAVEQPVGRILDKSGRNNHAFQSTSANRPTLSARYNGFEKTEDLSNSYWIKFLPTICGVDYIQESSTSAAYGFGNPAGVLPNTPNIKVRGKVKAGLRTKVALIVCSNSNATGSFFIIDIPNKAATIENKGTSVGSFSCTQQGDWLYVECATTNVASTGLNFQCIAVASNLTYPYTYSGTNGAAAVYVKELEALASNDGVNITYQRVNTATDYDSDATKFPRRINYAAGQSMTVSFPANLGSSCVVARANPGVSAVIAENQTVNTPLTLNTSHSGLVITSRSISVDEKARLDEYLDKKAIAK